MKTKLRPFGDSRGTGWFFAMRMQKYTWLIAFRWTMIFPKVVRPPGKPGYVRFYAGPLEIERSPGMKLPVAVPKK